MLACLRDLERSKNFCRVHHQANEADTRSSGQWQPQGMGLERVPEDSGSAIRSKIVHFRLQVDRCSDIELAASVSQQRPRSVRLVQIVFCIQ